MNIKEGFEWSKTTVSDVKPIYYCKRCKSSKVCTRGGCESEIVSSKIVIKDTYEFTPTKEEVEQFRKEENKRDPFVESCYVNKEKVRQFNEWRNAAEDKLFKLD